MKTKILMLGMVLSLMTISCTKKDNEDNTTISDEEAIVNTNIDAAADDIANVLEEQLLVTNIDGSNRGQTAVFAGCATITRTPAVGTTPIIGNTVSKVIDFGTRCVQPNGNVLSGKINMSFVYNPSAPVQVVTYIFENFFHNGRELNGQKTFSRSMTVGTPTIPSRPIVVMNMDMLITLTDGRTLTRKGTRTREMTAGFLTNAINDNEFKVTGEWTTTYPNTAVQTSTIVNPLLIKFSCIGSTNSSLISQGTINFVRNSNIASLDYGNGSCDNEAVFTLNGISRTITLKR